jgi:hypothetical protein
MYRPHGLSMTLLLTPLLPAAGGTLRGPTMRRTAPAGRTVGRTGCDLARGDNEVDPHTS